MKATIRLLVVDTRNQTTVSNLFVLDWNTRYNIKMREEKQKQLYQKYKYECYF